MNHNTMLLYTIDLLMGEVKLREIGGYVPGSIKSLYSSSVCAVTEH